MQSPWVGSRGFGHLFSNPATFWSLGAQVAGTIFDGGSRSAAVDAADAAYQASVAQYRQTVLAAFQDVEDNMATLNILKAEMKAQEDAVETAEKEREFMMNAYKAGTLAASGVLTVFYNVYTAKRGQSLLPAVAWSRPLG